MADAKTKDAGGLPDFELLEEAGSGGMGTVYRARDRRTGELLAVKVLRGVADADRFALEAEILSKLNHPAIVEYRRHGHLEDGTPYLAMEWIEGQNLEERLRRGNLTAEQALRIGRAIADALVSAHATGIIHRDLKPTNVLLAKETEAVKIVDFGVARIADSTGITHTGQAIGSAGYMSPEQARGAKVDARSDLFALGCVLFRCLAGRRPFGGADLLQFATSLVLQDAPRLRELAPHVPEALETLVAQMLEKEPEDRPESALHVLRAIDRILIAEDATHPAEWLLAAPPRSLGASSIPPGPAAARPLHTPASATNADQATAVHGRGNSSRPPPLAAAATPALPLEEEAPTKRVEARPRASRPVAVAIAIGVAAVGLLLFALRTTGTAPVAPPLVVAADASLPLRPALERACKTWSAVIAQGQSSDGAFAGEVRNDVTAWDTAQQVYALAQARRACNTVGAEVIASGGRAIDRLRTVDKHAKRKKPEERSVLGLTPSNAWALLALDEVGRTEPALVEAADRARADLLVAQNEDGGFRHNPILRTGASTPYATLLATWALLEDVDGGSSTTSARNLEAALGWLGREVLGDVRAVREVGFGEQLVWLLARASRRHEVDVVALRELSNELLGHCRFEAGACSLPIQTTGKIKLEGDAGRVITFWGPWQTLASHELAQRTDPRPEPFRAIARWGAGELARSAEQLANLPEYKLSEHLMVVAALLQAPEPSTVTGSPPP